MKRSLFEQAALGKHGENDVYIGTVQGRTVVAYSPDLRPTQGPEVETVMGSRPRTVRREDIEELHRMAEVARAIYPDAIGSLPAIPAEQEKAA